MVPLAVGTQTNGSVLRPASYCGVVGFKPSHGSISRHGVLKQSPTLDQIGVFARNVPDAALIARELFGPDGHDADVRPDAKLPAIEDWGLPSARPPRIAFVKSPLWPNATEAAQQAFTALAASWPEFVREVELPPLAASAVDWHRAIMEADLANSFDAEYAAGKDRLSATLREMIERGQRSLAVDYSRARDGAAALSRAVAELFEHYDAVLTPATTGSAPLGLASTGSPMFCTIWTLCGVPAISLPILRGEDGMPLGAQLVAAKDCDAQLLRLANWLAGQAPGARS
jgi:Asp-tRNA(Asn)/Glu-tRNA(Gln) amidotransferase A subunit family amidase